MSYPKKKSMPQSRSLFQLTRSCDFLSKERGTTFYNCRWCMYTNLLVITALVTIEKTRKQLWKITNCMRIYHYEFLTSVRVIEFNIVPKLPSLYANLGCWGGGKASLLGHIFSYSNFSFSCTSPYKKSSEPLTRQMERAIRRYKKTFKHPTNIFSSPTSNTVATMKKLIPKKSHLRILPRRIYLIISWIYHEESVQESSGSLDFVSGVSEKAQCVPRM